MKKRFTESQIVAAIKKQEAGIAVKDICREIGNQRCNLLQLES